MTDAPKYQAWTPKLMAEWKAHARAVLNDPDEPETRKHIAREQIKQADEITRRMKD